MASSRKRTEQGGRVAAWPEGTFRKLSYGRGIPVLSAVVCAFLIGCRQTVCEIVKVVPDNGSKMTRPPELKTLGMKRSGPGT